jgi:hypothetical protein
MDQSKELPAVVRTTFLSSYLSAERLDAAANTSYTPTQLSALVDLRPFTDAAPFMVGELMPLPRVYRLFNEMGVRHAHLEHGLRLTLLCYAMLGCAMLCYAMLCYAMLY